MKTFQECTKFQVSSMVREKDPSQAEASPPLLYLPRVATRRLWHQQRRRTATGKVGEKLFTVGT